MKNKTEIIARLTVDPATLSDGELLACVLNKNPGAAHLKAAEKLLKAGGFTTSEAGGVLYSTRLKAINELGRRMATKRPAVFLKPRDVWEEMRDIRGAKKEHFVVFYLDTRNTEIKREIVSVGTLNYNLVHPREVFEPAVRNLAAGIIVCHNHPSGCLEPSDEDRSLTKRLVQAGKLLGIELLDHVIITKEGFSSFKQKNLM